MLLSLFISSSYSIPQAQKSAKVAAYGLSTFVYYLQYACTSGGKLALASAYSWRHGLCNWRVKGVSVILTGIYSSWDEGACKCVQVLTTSRCWMFS